MDDRVVSYAQNREDVLLAAFFPEENGFYVDIGAHDPIEDSVTRYFYERGWRGINVEPNKRLFEKVAADRPEDINLNIGISDKPGKLKLRIYDEGDGLSTFSEEMKKDYTDKPGVVTKKYHDETVEVTTLKDVFEKNNIKKISFLKVDVEGYEYNVLKSNDWAKYRPEMICIEANHVLEDWRPLLEKNNYEKVFFDGLNDYYLAKEAAQRKEQFSYVQSILGRPIVSLKWERELVHQQSAIKKLQTDLQEIRNKEWEAQLEAARLQEELENQRRIRNLVKTLLRKLDLSVRLYVEKLNKPHRKHVNRHIPLNKEDIEKQSGSRTKLLETASKNDLDNFYTTKKSGEYNKVYLYKAAFFLNSNIRKILKFIFKALRKIYRLIRARG